MNQPAQVLPGQPHLWYPLVRPSRGVLVTLRDHGDPVDTQTQLERSFAALPEGQSIAVFHRQKTSPSLEAAWGETFLVLPSGGGARALLSAESPDSFHLGIPLMPGGRVRTRLLRACLHLPFVSQVLRSQAREKLTMFTKPESHGDQSQWQTFQTPVAIVEGVPGPLQKLVVLHSDGKHKHIYKVAGTQLARRAIEHEIQALTTLQGSGLAPKLVGRDYADQPSWFAQETIRGARPRPSITPAVLTWLTSLAARKHDHLLPQNVVPSLYDGRDWSKVAPEFEQLANVTRHCWTGGSIPCTQSHGDFTPWYTRMFQGSLQAFDWEFYSPARPALFDIFHYLLQTAVLLRQVPAHQALDRAFRILRGPAQPLVRVAGVADFEIEPLAALYLLLVAERDSILHTIERPGFDQVTWLASARNLWAKDLTVRMQDLLTRHQIAC